MPLETLMSCRRRGWGTEFRRPRTLSLGGRVSGAAENGGHGPGYTTPRENHQLQATGIGEGFNRAMAWMLLVST